MQKSASNQYTQRTVPGTAQVRGFADVDADVTVNGTWRYPNLGGPAAPTSPQSGATSAAPAAQTSYFYGGDDADNASFPVFQELAIEAASPEDEVTAVTGRVFVAQNPELFTYDADGNMLTDGRFRYTWNAENRLVRAQELVAPTNRNPYTITYAYDHRGRMVFKRITQNDGSDTLVKSTTYLWDGWNIIREIQWPVASGQWSVETLATSHYPLVTDYVWGLDIDGTLQGAGGVGGLLAVVRDDGVFLPTYDANGNISEYVSTNGTIFAHYDYSPFGETLIESGDLASAFTHRFSTKPWCPVTGLCEYQMRKYRPGIGRWLSRDPIGEDGGEGLYCYAFNSPMDSIDFIGLSIFDWKIWPWNWFGSGDSCQSMFSFDDEGWSYDDIMHGVHYPIFQISVTPEGEVATTNIVSIGNEFGYTVTHISNKGYACCCNRAGYYVPKFTFSVVSKSLILNKDSAVWNEDDRYFSDPRVNEYWRRSWKSHRFRLVKTHERRHRTHAKSNYDLSVNFLKGVSKNKYTEEADCLSAAKYYFDRAVFFFVNQDAVDGGKVERGEL